MLAVAVYPLQYAASLPVRLVDDVAQTLATRRALQGENEHLRSENTQLQAQVLRFAALETENERLRQLLDSSATRREDVAVADDVAMKKSLFSARNVHALLPAAPSERAS